MSEKERRVLGRPTELRRGADDAPTSLVGYAAVFNQETVVAGFFREVIAPGAFTDAIGRDDVRALYNHDPNYVLGRTAAGTLRLAEDATGLRYEIDPPATQWAADVLVTVGRGDVSGSSFGFEVNTDAWEYPPASSGQLPLRTIRAVTLYDVSAVTYPAYAETTAEARAKAAPPVSAAVLEAARAAEALMGATVVRQKRQAILEALL